MVVGVGYEGSHSRIPGRVNEIVQEARKRRLWRNWNIALEI